MQVGNDSMTSNGSASRRKGAVEWLKLDELIPAEDSIRKMVPLEGLEVGIRHVGPIEAKRMGRVLQRFKMEELARIVEARKVLPQDVAPQLYDLNPDAFFVCVTADGVDQADGVLRSLCEPVVEGVKGPLFELTKDTNPTDELERLGLLMHVALFALEVQAVRPTQFPAPPGARVDRPEA